MRGILLVVLAVVAAGGFLYGTGRLDPLFADQTVERERAARAAAEAGIRERMANVDGFELSSFVLGRPIDDELWDFRGEVRQNEEPRPLYGAARRDCPPDEARLAECWVIVELLINGRSSSLAAETTPETPAQSGTATFQQAGLQTDEAVAADPGAPAQSAATPDAAPEPAAPLSDGDADGAGSTAFGADAVAAAAPVEAPDPAIEGATETALAAPAPAPAAAGASTAVATHVITGSEVNMRAGPGRQFEPLALGLRGQELALLSRQADWAQFRLVGGENDGLEVWVFEPLTAPAN